MENQWHHLFIPKPPGEQSVQFPFQLRYVGALCEERSSSTQVHIVVAIPSIRSSMCPCRMLMGVQGTGLLLLRCFPEGWPGSELLPN